MDAVIEPQNINKNELFLCQLKNGYKYYRHKIERWKGDVIVDDEASKQKAKLLKFHENNRPPYFGTWRKKSVKISARNPFAKDEIFNYDVDSDDEWEEEEKGESIKDADSDVSEEEGDGYELDEMFVSHGYLSDDEQNDENAENTEIERHGILTKEEVLLDEKRKPIKKLLPIVVGCVWRNMDSDEKSLKILEQYRATYLTV
ncbi:chromatin assembly factor 1 subunit A-like protein [Leptotrombidium deliense]|uniref:Chromatin assembly factor 1 subunit A-like protein n=1 Tax=Leptotrombidium deliense TaxID=299467 RepID=A0A443STI4_9ACAR|nr:chromatin assembly factor 1 subunit A-like protein [Leptotrombidium deliense]